MRTCSTPSRPPRFDACTWYVCRLAVAAIVLLYPSNAVAQSTTARLEGVVHDSVRARPAAGAAVFVTRLRPQPSLFFSGVTDERGRYRIDSLTAGEYTVSFSTDVLDSLELTLPGQTIVIGEGEHARLDLSTPSGPTLRFGACPGLVLPAGKGAVVGRVHRADSDSVLRGATVVVSWRDLSVDRATLRPMTVERTGAVRTDSLGQYRMCGLPTEVLLLMQVQHEDRAGSAVTVTIPEDAGVALRHFSFSASGSRAIAALDSAAATQTVPLLGGRAALTGVVRSAAGQPLADAQVRVIDAAAAAARTDSLGRFSLSGLPPGTQLLDIRRLGYLITQIPVTLRDGETTTQNVTLARIVSLDSIKVLAQRTRYREFENRAKVAAFGKFLRTADLEKRVAFETSDFLRDAGFFIQGSGLDAKVVSPRSMGMNFSGRSCPANVVIDGMQHQDINLVPPQDVGAMEIYRSHSGAPIQYDSACGLVVIWTKR